MITKTTMAMFGLAASGLLAGCTETLDSQQLRTRGISATLEATAESASSTDVKATLKAGGDESNTYVVLSAGDRIAAKAGDKQVTMSAESSGEYLAHFNLGEGGTEVQVLLDREEDDDALNNTGTLPEPFDLEALPEEPVSRAEELTITWSPSDSGDDMVIHVDGDCIFSKTFDVGGDPGTYTIDADELDATNDEKAESCDVDVEIRRSRTGTTDPNLDPESSFVLTQVRGSRFTSAP